MIPAQPYPEWKKLEAATHDRPWGVLIGYPEIEETLGMSRNHPRFRHMIRQWKRAMLREHGRPMIAVKNEGYRIITFSEIAPRSKHLIRLGVRAMGRGVSVAENAPFSEMPEKDRRAVMDIGIRTGMLLQMCREKLRDLRLPAHTAQAGGTPRVLKSAK